MPIAKKTNLAHRINDSYFDLIRHFPLRQILTEAEAAAAGKVLSALMLSKPEHKMDSGEQQYLNALSVLLRDYETKARRKSGRKATPVESLKFLMEENEMNVEALGRVIGSQPAASMILSGKREISKAQLLHLAAHFGVSPALFLES